MSVRFILLLSCLIILASFTIVQAQGAGFMLEVKNPTSVDMVVEIAQIAALSFALATFLPVEISDWTDSRLLLMLRRVCSATIALLLVRILDILNVPHFRQASGYVAA